MRFNYGYCVFRNDNCELLRLPDGDRFGPYVLVYTPSDDLVDENWTLYDAAMYITRNAGVDSKYHLNQIENAERWARSKSYLEHYSPPGAPGSGCTTGACGQ